MWHVVLRGVCSFMRSSRSAKAQWSHATDDEAELNLRDVQVQQAHECPNCPGLTPGAKPLSYRMLLYITMMMMMMLMLLLMMLMIVVNYIHHTIYHANHL